MSIDQLIIVFGLAILVAVLILIYVVLNNRQPKDSGSMQMMLSLLSDLRGELNQSTSQNRQQLQERLDQIMYQISNHQQNTSQHLVDQHRNSNLLIKDITTHLSQIENTNQQILGFADQMKSLEKILQNPKQRGILGEYFLETLLSNILSPNQYKMQYRFKNGEIVDAAIFFRKLIIPVDAKFSLEKYNLMNQTEYPHVRKQLEKAFRSDVKSRIDETSKYIRPNENTTDFAFMFIPAEGVYHHLLLYQTASTNDLIEYAFKKRVILVSPTSFYAYLSTVLQGLKALKIEESVKVVLKKVEDLSLHLKEYEIHLDKVGKHLNTTVNMYNQACKEFGKIDTDILNITEGKFGGEYKAKSVNKPNESILNS